MGAKSISIVPNVSEISSKQDIYSWFGIDLSVLINIHTKMLSFVFIKIIVARIFFNTRKWWRFSYKEADNYVVSIIETAIPKLRIKFNQIEALFSIFFMHSCACIKDTKRILYNKKQFENVRFYWSIALSFEYRDKMQNVWQ